MAKLKGKAKKEFLARMAKGRAKNAKKSSVQKRISHRPSTRSAHTSKSKTNKRKSNRSHSMAKRKSPTRHLAGGKNKLMNGAKGAAVGLAIKYVQGKFAPNSPGLGEAAANIAASYLGKTEGVVGYQIGKIALAAIPQFTGTVPGTGANAGGMA